MKKRTNFLWKRKELVGLWVWVRVFFLFAFASFQCFSFLSLFHSVCESDFSTCRRSPFVCFSSLDFLAAERVGFQMEMNAKRDKEGWFGGSYVICWLACVHASRKQIKIYFICFLDAWTESNQQITQDPAESTVFVPLRIHLHLDFNSFLSK